MPIFIELDPSEVRDSGSFSRNAELLSIRVSSASFAVPGELPQRAKGPVATGVRFSPKNIDVLDDTMCALTFFEYLISRSATHKREEVLVRIECVLAATYQLRKGYKPSPAELAAFHKANVVFNCWPYFRELVQNSASRMEIPPPPVPFVKVQVKQPAAEQVLTEKSARRVPGRKKVLHQSPSPEGNG